MAGHASAQLIDAHRPQRFGHEPAGAFLAVGTLGMRVQFAPPLDHLGRDLGSQLGHGVGHLVGGPQGSDQPHRTK